MPKVLDRGHEISKLELQSCYYIHFRTNTFGKDINPTYSPPTYGLNSITAFFLQGCPWH